MLARSAIHRALRTAARRPPSPLPLPPRSRLLARSFSATPWRHTQQPLQPPPLPPLEQAEAASTSTSTSALLPQPPADAATPTLEDLILHSGKSVQEVLNSEEAVHAAMKLSDLKLIGYDHGILSITGWFTDGLVALHTELGLPWWAAIAGTTVLIRLCLTRLVINTQKHSVRLAAVNPQIQELMTEAKTASANKDTHMQTLISQRLRDLMKEHNVNPLRPLMLPLIQMPIFLTFFSIVRGLANLPLPQLKEGGLGWVTDLTAADPYYILPATSLLFTNLVFKFGADGVPTAAKAGSPMTTAHIRNFIQLTTFLSFPLIMYFPSALLFYWTFSTGFTLLQSIILRQPIVKRYLGLPITKAQALEPGAEPFKSPSYIDTFNAAKEYFQKSVKQASEESAKRVHAEQNAKRATSIKRKQQGEFIERIQEPGVEVKEAAAQIVKKPEGGREAEKQRRIEEARRRRARS
ncbi:preprotein translocase subunit YidC [Cryptococcus bacillisporus CA1873]|uniref:Preprotein translocase subunit YidC n=1 Tax=Cryptococcus bacillisporus CA1873 TaxID=1296111 RepID=A0ABR5B8V6_CRYGA|nr:preprotein translocase subunit YidC [Cryptococcus bacillisporus CA1873]|eukprot:KIR60000.1 preprotein translocase subunit YidC [Cryptococcus gattii CA1873]